MAVFGQFSSPLVSLSHVLEIEPTRPDTCEYFRFCAKINNDDNSVLSCYIAMKQCIIK